MAFVLIENRFSKEEIEELKNTISNIDDFPKPEELLWRSGWIIDKEKDVLFSCHSFGERDLPGIAYYCFIFENYLFKVMCNNYLDEHHDESHFFNFHQWLQRGSGAVAPNYRDFDNYIPEKFKYKSEQIHQMLSQAFSAYSSLVFGSFGLATCHFDESTVNPDWYPEVRTY